MHILAANCHWIFYVDFSGLFNISPGDNLSDVTKTHGLDCYLVDVDRLLYSKIHLALILIFFSYSEVSIL